MNFGMSEKIKNHMERHGVNIVWHNMENAKQLLKTSQAGFEPCWFLKVAPLSETLRFT